MTAILDCLAPLIVPGHQPARFEKAAASGADAVIIDLEDAVPSDAKVIARSLLRADFTELPVFVRINGAGTPWHLDDLAAALRLPIAGIVVPKVDLSEGLEHIRSLPLHRLPVVALIETARGLAESRSVAALPNVARLAFGSIDFCADIGCCHTREALLAARSELVLASRLANKLPPIDGVTTTIDDTGLLSDDARYSCSLGFGGKLCIHPLQVQSVQSGFLPSDEELEWAGKVVASGDGAVSVDGAMVDEPVRIRARAILHRSFGKPRKTGGSEGSAAVPRSE